MEARWMETILRLLKLGAAPLLVAKGNEEGIASPLHVAVVHEDVEAVHAMLEAVAGSGKSMDVLSGEGGFNSVGVRIDAVPPLCQYAFSFRCHMHGTSAQALWISGISPGPVLRQAAIDGMQWECPAPQGDEQVDVCSHVLRSCRLSDVIS